MKHIYILPFLIIIFSSYVIKSQDIYSISSYKEKTAHQIFDALVQAKEDISIPKPQFEMTPFSYYAAFTGEDGIIGLEEKAYDICVRALGKDSLNGIAALLSHEIIHYYKHQQSGFIKAPDANAVYELEADYAGGFLAYAAGYSTFGLLPRLFDLLYDNYDLDEKMDGYPPKTERIKQAQKAEAYSQQLVDMFKMGNYLSLLDDYENAFWYYEYILKTYQSRELYNNAAVSLLLYSLDLSKTEAEPYLYPLGIDAYSRINTTRDNNNDNKKLIQKKIRIALEHLGKAARMDTTYSLTYLTMGCAYSLQQEWVKAKEYANLALHKSKIEEDTTTQHGVYALLGVIAAQQNQEKVAQKWWKKAATYPTVAPLAQANLEILSGTPSPESSTTEFFTRAQFLYQGKPLSLEAYKQPKGFAQMDDTLTLSSPTLKAEWEFGIERLEGITIMAQQLQGKSFVIATVQDTCRTNTPIQLGNSIQLLKKHYGEPDQVFPARKGGYWLYYQLGSIFYIENQRLKEWAIYGLLD